MEKIAVFPNIDDYGVPVNILIERTLGYKTIACPPTTKKTMELGAKNSPDTVCTPFKVILGNYIEALNKGANVLIMPALGCRLGFYDVLLKQILTDLGYKFEMINLFEYAVTANATKVFKILNEVNPELTNEKFMDAVMHISKIVVDMDELKTVMQKNIAFQTTKGEYEKNYTLYINEVKKTKTLEEAVAVGVKYKEIFADIKINKPARPLRIGLVGDLYSVIEPHGNCYLEKWLAANKVEIVRPVNLTYLFFNLFDIEGQVAKSGGYTKYYIGGNAGNTVACSYEMAKDKLDGIIHVKAATCSPEITAMQILQNISKEYNIPIIYLTFDIETSEAGLHTRLEAFLDMLNRKEKTK